MTGGKMKLYTSTGTRKTIEQCNIMNVGLLMVDKWRNPDEWPYFAVDNGCFAAFNRGEEWDPSPFLRILARCKAEDREPDFIVIPDKPLSEDSLEFSKTWGPVLSKMYPGFPLYLAVQDGTECDDLLGIIEDIDGIFVGGSIDWKMETMAKWAIFAHERGLQCHVGRIGPVQRMILAELAGADSIDSTTWVQNKGGMTRYVKAYKDQTILEVEE